MEIIPGVHRVDHVTGANCYLVIDESFFFVIDTGMPGNGKIIADYIGKQGRKLGDLACIVLTHADIDHSGSAAELKAITGANVAIHAADVAVLAGDLAMKRPKWIIAPVFSLISKLIKCQPVEADTALQEGDIIGGYKVVHCPGHTHGSICLYHANDIIFVGDALRIGINGQPGMPRRLVALDIRQAMDSVKKISELEFSVMLPGHGIPVMKEASSRVRNLLAAGAAARS